MPDMATYGQIAVMFTTAAKKDRGSSTLLVVRGSNEMSSYLLGNDAAAGHLARAVGAQLEEVDFDAGSLGVGAVATLVARRRFSEASRAPQLDVDPAELSKMLERSMPPNSWVAITFREPKTWETKRFKKWTEYRYQVGSTSHASGKQGRVVARILVGAPTREAAQGLAMELSGAITGFDYDVRARVKSKLPVISIGFILGLVAFLAGMILGWPMAVNVVTLAAFIGVFVGLGFFYESRSAVDGDTALKQITVKPPVRISMPRKGKRAVGDEGKDVEPGYPLAGDTFMLGAQQIANLVAPQAGTASGQTTTRSRSVPPAFVSPIGPLVGYGMNDGVPAHLSAPDLFAGVLALGEPGSGKTVFLRQLYAWCLMQKARDTHRPGYPGRANTLIAFENKGIDDARIYQQWARKFGSAEDDQVYVIDLYDPNSLSIDLTDTGNPYTNSALSRAEYFVEAMTYSFTDGAIQSASRMTLLRLLTAGIALEKHPELTIGLEQVPPVMRVLDSDGTESFRGGGSYVEYADILCGSKGDDVAVRLASAVTGAVANQGGGGVDPDLIEAAAQLAPLFSPPRTPAQRRDDFKAPSSKLRELMKVKGWFDPSRTRVSWSEALDYHGSFVLNLGQSATGQVPQGELKTIMSSMLAFTLKSQIEQHCSGWGSQNRRVSLFSDELSLMSGSNPEVFRWFRDQGRSYGVNLYGGTQYLDQLEARLKATVMGLGSVFVLTQKSVDAAKELAAFLANDGQDWSASDIVNLSRYCAIVRSSVNGASQPAFTLDLGYWEEDMDEFIKVQSS